MNANNKLFIIGADQDALIFAQIFDNIFSDIEVYYTNRDEKNFLKTKTLQISGSTLIFSDKFNYTYNFDSLSKHNTLILNAIRDGEKFVQINKKIIKFLHPDYQYDFLFGFSSLIYQKRKLSTNLQYLIQLLEQNNIHNTSFSYIYGLHWLRETINKFYPITLHLHSDQLRLLNWIPNNLSHKSITWSVAQNQQDRNMIVRQEILTIFQEILTIIVRQIHSIENIGLSIQNRLIAVALNELKCISGLMEIEFSEFLISDYFWNSFLYDSQRNNREHTRYLLRKKQQQKRVRHKLLNIFSPYRMRLLIEDNLMQQTIYQQTESYHLPDLVKLQSNYACSLPLLQKTHDIIYKKQVSNTLLSILPEFSDLENPQSITKLLKKPILTPALYTIAGRNIERILINCISQKFLNEYTNCQKIKNQSQMIIDVTKKRILRSERRKNLSVLHYLQIELKLWEKVQELPVERLEKTFNRLIQFYIRNITDNFTPGIKTLLYLFLIPARLLLNIIKGTRWPKITGDISQLKKTIRNRTCVYVPTHKSHLDSLEITMSLFKKQLPIPRYAAASSLMTKRAWSFILRILGAFSVDRQRSNNILYLECLKHYSETLLHFGIPALIFPEGTRSRDGSVTMIKTGLLSSVLEAYRNSHREIAIIPICISYTSIPEDHEFCQITKKTRIFRYLFQRRSVALHFCSPLLVSNYADQKDGRNQLAQDISSLWQKNLVVMPNHLIAHILLQHLHKTDEKQQLQISGSEIYQNIASFQQQNLQKRFFIGKPKKIMKRGFTHLQHQQIIKIIRTPLSKDKNNSLTIAIQKPELIRYYANMVNL